MSPTQKLVRELKAAMKFMRNMGRERRHGTIFYEKTRDLKSYRANASNIHLDINERLYIDICREYRVGNVEAMTAIVQKYDAEVQQQEQEENQRALALKKEEEDKKREEKDSLRLALISF